MSLASAVPSAWASPALTRDTAGSCRRACIRHHPLGGAQVRSACGLACRYTRGGARRLPVALAAGGSSGYRDKFFVKVYAAAFYVDYSLGIDTAQWKEKIGIESFDSNSVFNSIFKAPVVKSLSIILVRDVDGKTFVNALNDVIARQIKNPNAEEASSLSTFQNTFLGRNLKQGTSIYLTWLEPSRMLISISENQDLSQVDAEIKSATVNYALYDGFFGNSPVSPSLRSSTAQLLEALLTK
ncbi:fatty-acid-binding protein 3, chloroplastic isoform X2 [Setaria viridis]|uniref:fatty-acid-binding protein 3, chloroplastic isoform X2 n=1 Tax=Setaria viridis TaxID=4556 RepID=UPI000647163A